MMLKTEEDVCSLLHKITYKPNYKMDFSIGPAGQSHILHLALRVKVVDINTRYDTWLGFHKKLAIALPTDQDFLLHEVEDFFRQWEEHEMDEWFRLDGKPVNQGRLDKVHGIERQNPSS